MLPVELTDSILDFLHDDHVTLGVCSRVFPRKLVERHLYANITFPMMPQTMRHVIGDRMYRDPRSIDPTAFQTLLVDSPHVANYVRSLRIEVITQSGSDYDLALSSCGGDEISPVLCKLTRLESVTLTPRGMRVMWTALGDVFRSTFFKTICQSTIKEVNILNIGRFPLSLLDDCKSLQRLSLQGTFLDIDLESTSPYPRLQSLRIIDQLSSQVFLTRLFTSWANTNSIRSLTLKLSVYCTGFIDKHVITGLLQAYSGSLTSLRIDFPDYVVRGTELDVEQISLIRGLAVSLTSLPHLERITFYVTITVLPQSPGERLDDDHGNDTITHDHSAMGQLLSAMPSTFKLSIHFRFFFPNGSRMVSSCSSSSSWSSLIMNFLTPPTFRRPAEIFVKFLGVDLSADPVDLLDLDNGLRRLVREGVVLIRADNNLI